MGRTIGKTEAFDSSTQKRFFLSKSIVLCCELSFCETTACRKLAFDEKKRLSVIKELFRIRRSFKKSKIKCFINPFKSMFRSYTPCKRQKIGGFFSRY